MSLDQRLCVGWRKFSRIDVSIELQEHLILLRTLERTAYSVGQAGQSSFERSFQRVVSACVEGFCLLL